MHVLLFSITNDISDSISNCLQSDYKLQVPITPALLGIYKRHRITKNLPNPEASPPDPHPLCISLSEALPLDPHGIAVDLLSAKYLSGPTFFISEIMTVTLDFPYLNIVITEMYTKLVLKVTMYNIPSRFRK